MLYVVQNVFIYNYLGTYTWFYRVGQYSSIHIYIYMYYLPKCIKESKLYILLKELRTIFNQTHGTLKEFENYSTPTDCAVWNTIIITIFVWWYKRKHFYYVSILCNINCDIDEVYVELFLFSVTWNLWVYRKDGVFFVCM